MGKIEITAPLIPGRTMDYIIHGLEERYLETARTDNKFIEEFTENGVLYDSGWERYTFEGTFSSYYTDLSCIQIIVLDNIGTSTPQSQTARGYEYSFTNKGFYDIRTKNIHPRQARQDVVNGSVRFFPFGSGTFVSLDTPTQLELHNIMAFDTTDDFNAFKQSCDDGTPDFSLIANLGGDTEQEDYDPSKQYYFYNTITKLLKDSGGQYSRMAERKTIKVNFDPTDKRLVFKPIKDLDRNYKLANYSGVHCSVSTDGRTWVEHTTLPADLDKVVRGNLKTDNAVYAGVLTTNIPLFSDKEKADDYEDGNIDASEADNAETLSQDEYSPVTKDIKTGTEENTTVMGAGVGMDKMTMYYKLTAGQLGLFGAKLFTPAESEPVAVGTKLVGANALNAIMGLRYYPFDISKVCTTTGNYQISLGSWESSIFSSGVITSNNGLIDMGTTEILPVYGNFLDYTNVSVSVYLPYCGIIPLDLTKVLGKSLNIKYSVDITTGKCKALLFANGLLFDSVEGTIARDCPISGVDAQSYNTALRSANYNVATQKLAPLNAITNVGSATMSGASAGMPFGVVGGIVGGVLGGATSLATEKMTYGMAQDQANQDKVNAKNNLPVYSCGSSGGQLAEIDPQYIYFIFAVNKVHIPANELELVGKPSNTSGLVGAFSGFLSCDVTRIETMASTTEKSMIKNMLASGIYI